MAACAEAALGIGEGLAMAAAKGPDGCGSTDAQRPSTHEFLGVKKNNNSSSSNNNNNNDNNIRDLP